MTDDVLPRRSAGLMWVAVLVLAGFFVGGVFGLLVTLVAVVAYRARGERVPAAFAAVLLALAGLLTVAYGLPHTAGVTPAFARHRPAAAASALAAGMCAMVAIAVAARYERSSTRAPRTVSRQWTRGAVMTAVGLVGFCIVGVVVRAAFGPPALRLDLVDIVANLRLGHGYARGSGASVEPTAAFPPLAPVLAAVLPGLVQTAVVAVSSITVLVTGLIGWRLGGSKAAVTCAAVAALLPSMWGQQLPEALAALAVTGAVALAWPDRLDVRSGALAGLCLGAAALARPECVVAGAVVVAWMVVARADARAAAVACVLAAATLFVPWQLWVHERFNTWAPSTGLGATLAGANADVVRSGPRIGDIAPRPAAPPGAEASLDRRRQDDARQKLLQPRTAVVAIARLGRAWDVWPPSQVVHARQARQASTPGGAAGVVLEGAVSVAAIAWLVGHRRLWRPFLPLYGLPMAFTLISLLTFGSRDLRAWTAPFVAVAFGLLVSSMYPSRPRHSRRWL